MHGKYREHLFRYSVHVPDAIRLDLAAEEVAQNGKGRGGVPTFFTREEDQAPAGIGAIGLVNTAGEVDAAVFRSQFYKHTETRKSFASKACTVRPRSTRRQLKYDSMSFRMTYLK